MTKVSDSDSVLVLGASSNGGVGSVTARRFAAQGARVVVSGRRAEPLSALAVEIGGAAIPCDVANEKQMIALAHQIQARVGPLRAIVNAVGHVVAGTIESSNDSDLQRAMETEFFGTFHMLRHLGPLVAGGGAIVVISSLATTHHVPGVLPYASAKAAVNNLVRCAAVEMAPRRVRVNAIIASLIDTPMIDGIRNNVAVMRAIAREIPLGRAAQASEIAAAVDWLCDSECFMTGSLMQVDGGHHLRRAPFPDDIPANTFAVLE